MIDIHVLKWIIDRKRAQNRYQKRKSMEIQTQKMAIKYKYEKYDHVHMKNEQFLFLINY